MKAAGQGDASVRMLRPRSKTELEKSAHPPGSVLTRRQSFSHVTNQHKRGGPQYESSEFTSVSARHFIVGQLISTPGTLPEPLSHEQVKLNAEATIDHSYIKKIPQSLLTAPGADGQLLRKGLLSGATIVFFTPGYEGKRFIYEHAKELGVNSVIIDVRAPRAHDRTPRARLAPAHPCRARKGLTRARAHPRVALLFILPRRRAAGRRTWWPRA